MAVAVDAVVEGVATEDVVVAEDSEVVWVTKAVVVVVMVADVVVVTVDMVAVEVVDVVVAAVLVDVVETVVDMVDVVVNVVDMVEIVAGMVVAVVEVKVVMVVAVVVDMPVGKEAATEVNNQVDMDKEETTVQVDTELVVVTITAVTVLTHHQHLPTELLQLNQHTIHMVVLPVHLLINLQIATKHLNLVMIPQVPNSQAMVANKVMVASNRTTEVNSKVMAVNNKVTAAHPNKQPQLQQPVIHKVTINNNRMEEAVDRMDTSKSDNLSNMCGFDADF